MMNLKTIAMILLFGALTSATPSRRQNPPGVVTSCAKPGTAALTFDDGPYNFSAEIVQTLNAHNAKGTFFYNGNNYGCIYDPDNVQRIQNALASGHQVASHTWSHPHLPSLSADQIMQEMKSVTEAIIKVSGVTPAFMRPPYGEYNDNVVQAAKQLGQTVVVWDFDSGDSMGADPGKQEADYTATISKKPPSILSLEHETIRTEVVLPTIIGQLQSAGYQLVTVAECLGANPYSAVASPAARDVSCISSFCFCNGLLTFG
ncbi:Chitin deacetylase [Leucoagaricus sp. SymC.cos]|nr:Chitin deacetylase [Leucoagaricus sp. SymC.cos]